MNQRGSVLVHVLVTGVIVALIATGVLRMTLMNYSAVSRATSGVQNKKEAEAMLHRAVTYWGQSGVVCSDIPGGLSCSGTPGSCSCDCPSASAVPRISVRSGGDQCAVTIVSSDPASP